MKKWEQQIDALRLENVSFHYPHDPKQAAILRRVHLSVKKGEFISIVGPSGSGKSTIFRLIAGLEKQLSGSIYLNGKSEMNRLGKVGYMPQQDLLIPWRTVFQNATLPLEVQQRNISREQITQMLQQFGLNGHEEKYPNELSGGMSQRVAFLRATLTNPDILLLDEPFSALDAMTKLGMQEWLLEQWQRQQATIVFITHDILEALFLSDRILMVTETPITKLEEVNVRLPRPRKRTYLDRQEMISLKNKLMTHFRKKVRQ